MKRILMLIPFALCGCSSDRQERREAILKFPLTLLDNALNDQPPPDPQAFERESIARSNRIETGGAYNFFPDNPNVPR